MSTIVGIDLGTTNSLVGAFESGLPVLLADVEGHRLTPSVVHFPTTGEPLVGLKAARAAATAPDRTIRSVKRLIGLSTKDQLDETAYAVVQTSEGLRIPIGDKLFSPAEISSLILCKLKNDAERALERKVTRAVITVPAYFNDQQRKETKQAGELAGLHVERILSEPTAAALAFGFGGQGDARQMIAVYDLGGGTFDISIIAIENGLFEVLATCGNTRLGGDDIDRAVADHILRQCGIDRINEKPESFARLLDACRVAKERLSFEKTAEINIPFLSPSAHIDFSLTRDVFERIAEPFIHATKENCLRAMADAKLVPGDLDAVLLVGGSTRIPMVRRLVAEWFGREPDTSQHPDEAVALGAVIQAGILSGAVQNTLLLDVTPLSLGVETFGGLMNVIIPRNTTIPAKAGEMFTNAVPGQTSLLVHILQGERELAKDNFSLGKFELPFETGPRGSGRAGIQFEIDADGILRVLARDTRTGTEKLVEIRRVTDISDETVGRMIQSSVEHAFEDMQERRLVELEIKARELLAATTQALLLAGNSLEREQTETVRQLSGELLKAVEARDPIGIEKGITSLDDATQELAAKVIESLI